MKKIKKKIVSILLLCLTFALCGIFVTACGKSSSLKIEFKTPLYTYSRGETADAFDFIKRQNGVKYTFAFSYLTKSESGETVSTSKAELKGNTFYLKEASRYTLYVSAAKDGKTAEANTEFDVVGETPVLLPPSLSLVYNVGSSTRISVLLERVSPTVIPASCEIKVDYFTYQETQAPELKSSVNTNPKTKTEIDGEDPMAKVSFNNIGLYEFHMVAYNGDRTADATFNVKVLPDQSAPIEGISAYKNAEFGKKENGETDSSIIRLVGSPDLSKASYAVLDDEFREGQVARFEFYGRNMPSYIGLFNVDDETAADPNSIVDGGRGYAFTTERLGSPTTARVYGYTRMGKKTSSLKYSTDAYPLENFGFNDLEDGKHYFFEICAKTTGKTEVIPEDNKWGGDWLGGKTVQHIALFYSLYEVNEGNADNPYTIVAHSQVRFESSIGGCWFEVGEEVKGKLVAYSSITKDVTFKYYKDSLIDSQFNENDYSFDAVTKVLSWSAVDGAENYIISLSDESYERTAILDSSVLSYDLSDIYDKAEYFSDTVINVYASCGNNTFSGKKYSYRLTKYPAGLEGVIVSGDIVSYDENNKTVDVSLSGGSVNGSQNKTLKTGYAASMNPYSDDGKYTLDEKGVYTEFVFKGNNMPVVEFFASDITGNRWSESGGSGFVVSNGYGGASMQSELQKKSFAETETLNDETRYSYVFDGLAQTDAIYLYDVSYYDKKLEYKTWNSSVDTDTLTAAVGRKASKGWVVSQQPYSKFSMYSLLVKESEEQEYRYVVGMYKDADGKVYIDAKLYKVSGETETLFAFCNNAVKYSQDSETIPDNGEISGYIVAHSALKGIDVAEKSKTDFTFKMPYFGTDEHNTAFKDATFNADGTVTLKSGYITKTTYDAMQNTKLGYVALKGSYEVGTFVDVYFKGNNMPIVSMLTKYVTDDLTNNYNGEATNKGFIISNGMAFNGGNPYDNKTYRFEVYGPNRIYDGFNAMDRAYYVAGTASNPYAISMAKLATMPEQNFKYTVGIYAGENGKLKLLVDMDKLDESGNKTEDYFDLDAELFGNLTASDINGDKIILYGALNGGNDVTFGYGKPYKK